MSTSISTFVNEVRWSDGQGITYQDLNDMQSYERAFMYDQIVGTNARALADYENYPSENWCFFQGAGAYPQPGGGARSVTNVAGTLWIKTPSVNFDGLTPTFLPVYVDDNVLFTDGTAIVADATNPRWYTISLSVTRLGHDTQARDFQDAITGVVTSQSVTTKTRMQLTKTVTAGTPAASPTPPSAPAGTVPWCMVYVPAAHATTLPNSSIADARIPFRRRSYFVTPNTINTINNTGGTFTKSLAFSNDVGYSIDPGAGTTNWSVWADCPVSDRFSRVLRVVVYMEHHAGNQIQVAGRTFTVGPSLTNPNVLTPTFGTTSGSGITATSLIFAPGFPFGYVAGPVQEFLWCHGQQAPINYTGSFDQNLFTVVAGTARKFVYGVQYDIAGG